MRSRPKFASDQTFQTEIISDQNFQTEIHPDQIFQTQVTSDQTFQTQKVSDQTFQTEGVLIRPSSDHGPDSNSDHCPEINQTMIRLKCARRGYVQTQMRSKRLWSDPNAFEAVMIRPSSACSYLWSDWSALQTGSDQSSNRVSDSPREGGGVGIPCIKIGYSGIFGVGSPSMY